VTEHAPVQTRSMDEIAARIQSRYHTVEEMAVAAIREAILSGIYTPGQKLRQEELAVALGTSRIPIRAALRQLDAEGLVVFSPHRGAAVRALDPADIEEIYRLRVILETFALRAAIERISPGQLDELSTAADELDVHPEGPHWLQLRQEFYRKLYEAAATPRTTALIFKLRADVGRYWLSLKVLHQKGSEHRIIIDAIRSGNAELAERWLADHLAKVSEELQRRMREPEAPGRQ